MLNKIIDSRTQWIQKLTIAASIALFAPIAAFASPSVISAEEVTLQAKSNDALLQKQSEIDAYVFEQHKDELAKQGIQVTNTGAVGDKVEVGILDYTDKKADYLYNLFGTELVKVVEGQQAVLLDNSAPLTTTTTASVNEAGQSNSQFVPWIIALVVVVIGAIALFSRKLRVSRK
jgi:hypothetical protein